MEGDCERVEGGLAVFPAFPVYFMRRHVPEPPEVRSNIDARKARRAAGHKAQPGDSAGGIIGYVSWGFIADAIGRRKAFMVSFAVSAAAVAFLFPFSHEWWVFLAGMPFAHTRPADLGQLAP